MLPKSGSNVHLAEKDSFIQKGFVSWIRKNIRKRECVFYETGAREGICKCGYPKTHHVDEAIKSEDHTEETWNKDGHFREVPTDAFGDITFGGLGKNTSKYARVSTDSQPVILYQLLTEQWKLSPPNLLISVTGGFKNFYMKNHLKKMFRRGLVKVAQTTGAWIITGGTHSGVMKYVGQAVRDYAMSNSTTQSQMVAIGVATWGTVHNGNVLVDPQGCFPANYEMDVQGQGHLSCLDNNHTHFLLVDDGTIDGCGGVEIELRGRLEKLISQQPLGNKESGVTIPVVCVVLDGGPGTLNTIYNAMLNGTPCVILEGSGRIADVIAEVAILPLNNVTISLIHQLMKKFFGIAYEKFSDFNIIEWTKKIQDIIRMPHLLTVCGIIEGKREDVDVAILQALFKASRTSKSVGAGWERQLELAIAWNRVDIAETEIFTEESQWKSADLHGAMFSALIGHKHQFVRLLLDNGVSLNDFLQKDTLKQLYFKAPSCSFLCMLKKKAENMDQGLDPTTLVTLVYKEVQELLGSFIKPLRPPWATRKRNSRSRDETSISLQGTNQEGSQRPLIEDTGEPRRDPGRDLFLWAVIQNNRELAEIAWEQCGDCLSAALAASTILKKMAEEEDDEDEAKDMQKLANHYEKHAIGVFSECYDCDQKRAQRLLVRTLPSWGTTTCLRLALEADAKSFVAQSGVQAHLTQIWCGELAVDNPVWRVMICMLFFPLIYTGFLTFSRDKVIQREARNSEEMKNIKAGTGSKLRRTYKAPDHASLQHMKPLSCSSRLAGFYSSPQVKFFWNIVSYAAFLLLFAVVLMMDFQPTPSPREVVFYIWVLSLVCEELRQLFHDPDGLRKKAMMYIQDLWNILDVLSIIIFIIGLVCRLIPEFFYTGKIFLCMDFVVFCLRLMAIFTISKTLGPKIIMVRRMMRDIFFFMFLLAIWMVAYGVAKQGILIHNETRLGWIFRGAVYDPYLIVFGNIPTNIDNAFFDKNACSMNGTDPLKPKCPVLSGNHIPAFPEWLTIFLLCVYLLFTNILLLNLLIAIFNFTFQEVQDNTDTIWKFQRHELIKEYHSRPAAPPPFILLIHVYRFVKWCCPSRKYKEFKEFSQPEEEELLSWEALIKDQYLQSTQLEQSQSSEGRIIDIAQNVTTITDRLEREEQGSSAAIEKRLARLEEQANQSAKALQWIMDSLRSLNDAATEAPILLTADGESSEGLRNMPEKNKGGFHISARQCQYPNTKVVRFPVPEEKVPWEVCFTSYMPPHYASEDSGDHVDGSESEALDNYRNPGGRTGMRGRGALSCLGPNLNVDLVLTRWRDSKRSVLEFLAVWDESQAAWALPGGPVQSGENLPVMLMKVLDQKLYETINTNIKEGTKVKQVFEGYVDDSRNTDNAWVETTVLTFHLDRTSPFMDTVATSHGSSQTVQWQEVSGKAQLCSNQRDNLRLIAKLHHRKF
ncbi:transient receptor potential cation channel subfamily M member 2-like isoform X2 [Genypterus blacodes]|uniref:transient receptor potential cation channel subfamily M member 2-like isoform X2 n=1 Tax=Genypterus blacodes TaxID=154954 RepID=UPI003F75E088